MMQSEEAVMSDNEMNLKQQLEKLKAENEFLRKEVDYLHAQRRDYLDYTFGPAEKHALDEEELAAALRDPNPMSLSQFLADLGIIQKSGPNPQ
jgi:hypothetical protein